MSLHDGFKTTIGSRFVFPTLVFPILQICTCASNICGHLGHTRTQKKMRNHAGLDRFWVHTRNQFEMHYVILVLFLQLKGGIGHSLDLQTHPSQRYLLNTPKSVSQVFFQTVGVAFYLPLSITMYNLLMIFLLKCQFTLDISHPCFLPEVALVIIDMLVSGHTALVFTATVLPNMGNGKSRKHGILMGKSWN